jgi:hypothetical protein
MKTVVRAAILGIAGLTALVLPATALSQMSNDSAANEWKKPTQLAQRGYASPGSVGFKQSRKAKKKVKKD